MDSSVLRVNLPTIFLVTHLLESLPWACRVKTLPRCLLFPRLLTFYVLVILPHPPLALYASFLTCIFLHLQSLDFNLLQGVSHCYLGFKISKLKLKCTLKKNKPVPLCFYKCLVIQHSGPRHMEYNFSSVTMYSELKFLPYS